jgi:hypothetical protein
MVKELAASISIPLSIFKDINEFEIRLTEEFGLEVTDGATAEPVLSSISVIEDTYSFCGVHEVVSLIFIRFEARTNRTCIPETDKLRSELKTVVVAAKDREHVFGVAIPMAVDGFVGVSRAESNSRISRHTLPP